LVEAGQMAAVDVSREESPGSAGYDAG